MSIIGAEAKDFWEFNKHVWDYSCKACGARRFTTNGMAMHDAACAKRRGWWWLCRD